MKLIPDTSVIVDGRITSVVQEPGEYNGAAIIVPKAVIAELEAQADQGSEIGFTGLRRLQELLKLTKDGKINTEYGYCACECGDDECGCTCGCGEDLSESLINAVKSIDGSKLITGDKAVYETALAHGVQAVCLPQQTSGFAPLKIEKYLDSAVHLLYLKEGAKPAVKKGSAKDTRLTVISDALVTESELSEFACDIVSRALYGADGAIEMERQGLAVIRIGGVRYIIARRPFSDAFEITAVRLTKGASIDSYSKSAVIKKRLLDKRCSLVIAGVSGSGKTGFAESIAEFLAKNEYLAKTINTAGVNGAGCVNTGYGALEDSLEDTAEVIQMMHPDYVIFDEPVYSSDFEIFANLRLAGLGMVCAVDAGDVHNALLRILSGTKFGVLPQVVDTLVLMKDGDISRIYDLVFEFRVPDSLPDENDELFARPVITVVNTETGEAESEIFKCDDEIVVSKFAPQEQPKSAQHQSQSADDDSQSGSGDIAIKLVEREIQREIGRFTDGPVDVKMQSENKAVVYIDDKDVPAAIGKGGKNVASIVNKLSIGIDIRPRSELPKTMTAAADSGSPSLEPEFSNADANSGAIDIRVDKKYLTIAAREHKGKIVDVFGGKEYLFTATVNDMGEIHMSKSNSIAMEMIRRYNDGEEIRLRPV